jgi:hypothetical protein
MLRRVQHDGSSESWLLVPQIEHARLCGALAASWGDATFKGLRPYSEVLAAIGHHDDGWADWDAAPDVDRASGRPLSFVEMPLELSIDIWRRSIYLACSRGHLAAHMVSAHFTALLQKSSPKWSQDPRRFQSSRQFFDEQSEHREIWFSQWQRAERAVRTRKMAGQALSYLQFFDVVSLWLCGAVRTEAQSFPTPEGYEMSVAPVGQQRFTARPWPLVVGRWNWTAKARRVPVAHYANREALAAAPSEAVELPFELVADP